MSGGGPIYPERGRVTITYSETIHTSSLLFFLTRRADEGESGVCVAHTSSWSFTKRARRCVCCAGVLRAVMECSNVGQLLASGVVDGPMWKHTKNQKRPSTSTSLVPNTCSPSILIEFIDPTKTSQKTHFSTNTKKISPMNELLRQLT